MALWTGLIVGLAYTGFARAMYRTQLAAIQREVSHSWRTVSQCLHLHRGLIMRQCHLLHFLQADRVSQTSCCLACVEAGEACLVCLVMA